MINYPHAYYLRFFLNKGINVIVWNYRGYGRSPARGCCRGPHPINITEDAVCVLKYLKDQMGLTGRIGVYGRSLGGIATAYLAEYVDMVICDRSFSNLHDVVKRKFFGDAALWLYKISTLPSWRTMNDINFLTRGLQSDERELARESIIGIQEKKVR